MNINQNNIQRQQPTTANRQQSPSFQSVETNFTYVAPRKYKQHYLKFYKFHARMYGIAKAALLYQIINAFEHKKFHQGTQLIYLDYSKRVLSMMMGGILSPYQVGNFLQQLNNEGFITLIAKQGRSDKGNRIYRGRRYMYDLSGMDTGIISVDDAKEHSCEEALIIQRVKQSCSNYNKQMKSGYLNPKTTRDLVASQHLNDITRDILTESQQRKARAKLTKKGILHKTRSRNKKFGRMTTNQWVYSTNLDALKDYQTSKHANYNYTDKELYTYNELGINLSTTLYFQRQNTPPISYEYSTHNPEIGTQKYILINKSKNYNHTNDGFIEPIIEKPIYNFNEYEKDVAKYEKAKYIARKKQTIAKRKAKSSKHIDVSEYDTIKLPSRITMMELLLLKTPARYDEAELICKWAARKWAVWGAPRNWVKVLLSRWFWYCKNKNDIYIPKDDEQEWFMGSAPPPEYITGGKSKTISNDERGGMFEKNLNKLDMFGSNQQDINLVF